jgi:hypothetical protein
MQPKPLGPSVVLLGPSKVVLILLRQLIMTLDCYSVLEMNKFLKECRIDRRHMHILDTLRADDDGDGLYSI